MADFDEEVSRLNSFLAADLHAEVRGLIERRVDAMERHMAFLADQGDPRLELVGKLGWSRSRLRVVCGLNSFYQVVLAPLASSARASFPRNLGGRTPINYGTRIRFDVRRSRAIRRMMAAFNELVTESGIPLEALEANQFDDMVLSLLPYE
jgi:hypothetical protein